MAFNNAADVGYVNHDHKEFDRLYKLHDTLFKELSKNTNELSVIKEITESLFREIIDLKKEMKDHHNETHSALKEHNKRITALEKYQVKMNTTRNVIVGMVTLGTAILGYLYFFK